ncbi:MAG: hypothetical protein K9G44_06940, partial [Melioribacteraceae bacterium]|nr:hypothetical protein [Melioribacteraceae bacterium]
MKSNIFKTTVLLALLFSGFISAQDESLSVLNLQGVVRDDKGGAVDDDNYPFTFRIYNVLTGGTALWEESQDLDVISGVYSANLGEVSAFSTGNSGAGLGFDEPYYIGVSFNNKNEISPRVRLTAAPYALALQGAGNTFPSSGTVTVGTSSDPSQLDVEGDVDISGVLNEDSDLNIG